STALLGLPSPRPVPAHGPEDHSTCALRIASGAPSVPGNSACATVLSLDSRSVKEFTTRTSRWSRPSLSPVVEKADVAIGAETLATASAATPTSAHRPRVRSIGESPGEKAASTIRGRGGDKDAEKATAFLPRRTGTAAAAARVRPCPAHGIVRPSARAC